MSVEQSIASLTTASNKLTGTVSEEIGNINKAVSTAKTEIDSYVKSAVNGYPAFNLINNAGLNRFESDGKTPSGFHAWTSGLSVKFEVVTDDSSNLWWQTPAKHLRITYSWNADDKYKNSGGFRYSGLLGAGGNVPKGAPFMTTTRGFDYRVVKNPGLKNFRIGWESGNRELQTSISSNWIKAQPLTYAGNQTEAICSVYVDQDQPTGEFVIELRNIYVNIGVSERWSLGLNELMTFPYTTRLDVTSLINNSKSK